MAAGITGQGAVIEVIDDGYDLAHPAFRDRVVEAIHTATADLEPMPVEAHGTHVSGIAPGVAPGADLALYTYAEPEEPLDLRTAAHAFYAKVAQDAVVYSNSWGIDIDINEAIADRDFFTEQSRDFVEALRAARETGVVVFPASNDPELPDIDVSAALPLAFPELQSAWLAVVNLAPDGGASSA